MGARALDYLFVGFIGVVFMFGSLVVVGMVTGDIDFGAADDLVYMFFFFFAWGLWLFLYEWLFLMAMGATPGKAATGIKVVADDGGPLTQGQGVGRAALFALPQSITCVGHFYVLTETVIGFSSPRGTTLHDRAAGTIVVQKY